MLKKPLALAAYEKLADAYAAKVDTKPHNAYYERPATLSLLPDVNGRTVLDAGCGSGVYSAWLIDRGARVVAVDVSPRMLHHARGNVGNKALVCRADLGGGAPFLKSGSFDVVLSALSLDYLPDWEVVFRDYHRVLRAGGHFVLSVGHPFFDFEYFKTDSYFDTEEVSCEWRGFGIRVDMPSYRRSLSTLVNTALMAGFDLEQILEPKPTAEFKKADLKRYEKLMRQPAFLCVKARRR